MQTRKCEYCGKDYKPVRKSQRFCGKPKTCRTDWHNAHTDEKRLHASTLPHDDKAKRLNASLENEDVLIELRAIKKEISDMGHEIVKAIKDVGNEASQHQALLLSEVEDLVQEFKRHMVQMANSRTVTVTETRHIPMPTPLVMNDDELPVVEVKKSEKKSSNPNQNFMNNILALNPTGD